MDIFNNLSSADYGLIIGGFLCPILIIIAKLKNGKKGRYRNIKKWDKVEATILSREIKNQSFHSAQRSFWGWKSVKAYTPSICYEYQHNGKTYTGSKISQNKTISSNRKSSQKILDKYPVSKKINVYVNPQDSSEAYINPDNAVFQFHMLELLFAVIFPAIAVVIVIYKY